MADGNGETATLPEPAMIDGPAWCASRPQHGSLVTDKSHKFKHLTCIYSESVEPDARPTTPHMSPLGVQE